MFSAYVDGDIYLIAAIVVPRRGAATPKMFPGLLANTLLLLYVAQERGVTGKETIDRCGLEWAMAIVCISRVDCGP